MSAERMIGLVTVAVLLLSATGIDALAQTESPLSPHEIHRWVGEGELGIGKSLWSRPGICETMHSHQAACGTTIESNIQLCSEACQSKLLSLDVLPAPGPEVVLHLTDISSYSRLSLFRRLPPVPDKAERWELVDYVDSSWSKYGEVTVRALELGGRKYMIMSETTGGTGAFERYETWYEFRDGATRKALVFPQETRRAPLGVMWEAKFTFQDYEASGNTEYIRFQMHLHLDNRAGYSFQRTVPIVFARRPGEVRFKFQTSESDLAPEVAVDWWRIPETMPIEGEAWEYGALLYSIRVPEDLKREWTEEYQRLRGLRGLTRPLREARP